jgi:hypothetical protein
MIQFRHQQRSVWEGLFDEEVAELWEPWMRVVDELLEGTPLPCGSGVCLKKKFLIFVSTTASSSACSPQR